LDALSNDQLQELLGQEDKFKALLEEVVKDTPCPAQVTEMRSRNVQMAKGNKDIMQQCREVANQITIVRSTDYAPAKAQFDNKLSRQTKVVDQLDPTQMLQGLTELTKAADDESDRLIEQYKSGGISLEEFLSDHRKARTLYHTREQKRSIMEKTIGSYLS